MNCHAENVELSLASKHFTAETAVPSHPEEETMRLAALSGMAFASQDMQ